MPPDPLTVFPLPNLLVKSIIRIKTVTIAAQYDVRQSPLDDPLPVRYTLPTFTIK